MSEKKIPPNQIEQIFEELIGDGLIEKNRKLIANDRIQNFGTKTFRKIIYYNPNISELTDNTIKISLLHEEGHIKEGHCGVLLYSILTVIGVLLIVIDVFWILISFYLSSSNFYFDIWLLLLFFGIFFIVFRVRLASHPLQIDEYISDKWASEKMRDTYHHDTPSRILENALIELDQKNQENNSKKGYLNSFKLSIKEYHPLIFQRVSNVAFQVDKK